MGGKVDFELGGQPEGAFHPLADVARGLGHGHIIEARAAVRKDVLQRHHLQLQEIGGECVQRVARARRVQDVGGEHHVDARREAELVASEQTRGVFQIVTDELDAFVCTNLFELAERDAWLGGVGRRKS